MGPSRSLPCLVLLFLLASSRASVLEGTCKSFAAGRPGIGYNYCIKCFQASKESATADKRGLAVIASKLTGAAANSIVKRIHALMPSAKTKHFHLALDACDQLYSLAVDELDVVAKGVAAGTPRGKEDALQYLTGALDAPVTCETGFSEMGVKSPLVAEDSEFTKDVDIAFFITHSFMDKGKDVVPPVVEVSVQEHPDAKRRNYGHYHEESGPTHFCKVILPPKMEALPLPLDFTKHFPVVPKEFSLKTNIGCSWWVTVKVVNDRVTLDEGWAAFAAIHQVMIGYMLTFKLLTPTRMKVIVFNDDDVEVVTKCKNHDQAFAVTA